MESIEIIYEIIGYQISRWTVGVVGQWLWSSFRHSFHDGIIGGARPAARDTLTVTVTQAALLSHCWMQGGWSWREFHNANTMTFQPVTLCHTVTRSSVCLFKFCNCFITTTTEPGKKNPESSHFRRLQHTKLAASKYVFWFCCFIWNLGWVLWCYITPWLCNTPEVLWISVILHVKRTQVDVTERCSISP